MAEEVLYASAGGEPNKRKYEDSPSPVARRATGFSTAPDSGAPPPLYASVPPPMSEIELAKQKAQEIAARLVSNADPSKRARVENGGNGVGGYDSSDYSSQKPMGMGFSAPPQVASSGYPGPSKKIEIPNGRVGVIIGKGGETIKYLQLQSGAKIQVTRDMDADPNSTTRGVDLMGTPDQIAKAEQLIHEVLSEAEAGGSGSGTRRMTGQSSGAEQFEMKVPNNKVGLVIGKGGETIKNMQARTGARIQVIPLHLPPGDMSQERTVQIDGTSEQIEAAKQLVNEVISENRMRNSTSSGGYPQQGYQTRPPTNWGQPGPPMQQPGYSYTQPGAYPSPSPQYNMNQPPYSGYPSQTAAGGYTAGWDQSSAAAAQNQQGGAYDYYNQQQQQQQQPAGGGPATSTDASGYGYSQAPAAYSQGQGYSQDSYAAYYASAAQSGYTQPQQNASAGYDQQQQGYNSAYGNVSNPTADGHTASYGTQGEANQAPASGQSYNAGGQPVANPSYPPQASQPGYGAQGGYGAPPQAQKSASGHPPSGYAQTESGYQRPPSAGYATSQPGYGAPPAATQASYGQQQPNPYGGSYGGGGYAQPSAYPSDGAAYDAAAAPPQSAQQSGSAKASPPPS